MNVNYPNNKITICRSFQISVMCCSVVLLETTKDLHLCTAKSSAPEYKVNKRYPGRSNKQLGAKLKRERMP